VAGAEGGASSQESILKPYHPIERWSVRSDTAVKPESIKNLKIYKKQKISELLTGLTFRVIDRAELWRGTFILDTEAIAGRYGPRRESTC
jgi:hypothetical protein